MTYPYDKPIKNESKSCFDLFVQFRDIGPSRTLELLHRNFTKLHQKKKVSLRTIKTYSAKYHWIERAAEYDAAVARRTARQLFLKRQEEIDAFIEKDFKIAKDIQGLVERELDKLKEQSEIDVRQLRHISVAYRDSRLWVQEILGLLGDGESE